MVRRGLLAMALWVASTGPARASDPPAGPPGAPPADPAPDRPATPARRAAQGLAIGAAALVAGGVASFVVGALAYAGVRDGCGATTTCSASDLAPGKGAVVAAWALTGTGVAAALAAVIAAALDRPGAAKRVDTGPRITAIAPWAAGRAAGLVLQARF